jgi:hypothetical protein
MSALGKKTAKVESDYDGDEDARYPERLSGQKSPLSACCLEYNMPEI